MPFNIGPGELIIVLIIALIVVGPGKLPDVGSALGKSIREFRKAAADVKESTSLEAAAPAPAAPAVAAAPVAVAPAPAPAPAPVAPVPASAPVAPAPAPVASEPVAVAPVADADERPPV
jgi:TatA/E family protein of Tat protein translocase